MSSPRCPQCGQPLPDPAVPCASCGYDRSRAAMGRTNLVLTLLLFFAMGICLVGVGIVWFRSGDSSEKQRVAGLLLFIAGFAIYVIARVIIILRQRRKT